MDSRHPVMYQHYVCMHVVCTYPVHTTCTHVRYSTCICCVYVLVKWLEFSILLCIVCLCVLVLQVLLERIQKLDDLLKKKDKFLQVRSPSKRWW